MDLAIQRNKFLESGIFGQMSTVEDEHIPMTLEHAYLVNGVWIPKVASGSYVCRKHAPLRLNYTTYMLLGVPDFQGVPVDGILIHILNFNKESRGCIGVGKEVMGDNMITDSRQTFERFMRLQDGVFEFTLTIS